MSFRDLGPTASQDFPRPAMKVRAFADRRSNTGGYHEVATHPDMNIAKLIVEKNDGDAASVKKTASPVRSGAPITLKDLGPTGVVMLILIFVAVPLTMIVTP